MEGPCPPAAAVGPAAELPGVKADRQQLICLPPTRTLGVMLEDLEACLALMPGDDESPITRGMWRTLMEVLGTERKTAVEDAASPVAEPSACVVEEVSGSEAVFPQREGEVESTLEDETVVDILTEDVVDLEDAVVVRGREPGSLGEERMLIPLCAVVMSDRGVEILLGEALSVYYNNLQSNAFVRNHYVATIYKAIGAFIFGAAVSQSLTDIAKYTIGRLRPHFLSVCKVNWAQVNCSAGYIENFVCEGDSVKSNEARLSFYSGHSSFSMYCMLFLALYLHSRMRGDWARLLRPTIQFALVAASVYVGLSRVSDYKHHWSDVLTGLIQGAIVAVLIVVYVSDFFKVRKGTLNEKEEDSHTTLHETSTNGNHYGSNLQP
uniref:Phospholipid phosphatase 1 n=1 Tax=Leptobrachium leishanense TaxID=445787 RepID=A0A8C5M7W2_9ANUR